MRIEIICSGWSRPEPVEDEGKKEEEETLVSDFSFSEWDTEFLDVDTDTLFELMLVSDMILV